MTAVDAGSRGDLAVNSAVKPNRGRRPNGTGTYVYIERSNRWRGSIRVGKQRLDIYAPTRELAEAKVLQLRIDHLTGVFPPTRTKPARRRRPNITPLTIEEVVGRAIDDAFANNWSRATFIAVLVASVRPTRLRLGIYGPCFYCGDPTAGTVDHLRARARGGGDTPGNVVSACLPCNLAKGDRLPHEFTPPAGRC